MNTTVINIRTDSYDVDISRSSGSPFGNPFIIGVDGDRDSVIKKYEINIRRRPDLLAQLVQLRGKRLGCYCKPLACHGDVLVKLIEEYYD